MRRKPQLEDKTIKQLHREVRKRLARCNGELRKKCIVKQGDQYGTLKNKTTQLDEHKEKLEKCIKPKENASKESIIAALKNFDAAYPIITVAKIDESDQEEAAEDAARRQLHDTLNDLLAGQIDYWKTQTSFARGTCVLDDQGKKVRVPSGIGEMIIQLDHRRDPKNLQPSADKKAWNPFRFFATSAPIPIDHSKCAYKTPNEIIECINSLQKLALQASMKYKVSAATKDLLLKISKINLDMPEFNQLRPIETHLQALSQSTAQIEQSQRQSTEKPIKEKKNKEITIDF